MKIFVVRHGQTNANVNRIISGVTDVDINETGIIQAKEAGEIMYDKDYDLVFCSPLIRTRHTCELVNTKHKPVIYDDRIKERNAGIYECTIAYPNDEFGLKVEEYWDYNKNIKYKNAESIDDVYKRVSEFLQMLKEKYSDKTVLIVTHDGVCRNIKRYFNGVPESGKLTEYSQKNCEIREYELGESYDI